MGERLFWVSMSEEGVDRIELGERLPPEERETLVFEEVPLDGDGIEDTP